MARKLGYAIVLPLFICIVLAVAATLLVPASFGFMQDAAIVLVVVLLAIWWGLGLARWMCRFRWLTILSYIFAHLVLGIGIFLTVSLIGYGIQGNAGFLSSMLMLLSVPVSIGWLLAALVHLVRNRRHHRYSGFWWWPLQVNAKPIGGSKVEPDVKASGESPAAQRTVGPPQATQAKAVQTTPSSSAVTPSIYQDVSIKKDGSAGSAVRIPPRATVPPPAAVQTSSDNRVSPAKPASSRSSPSVGFQISSPRDGFLEQARRYATRSEAKMSFVPFMHYWPTYSDMSREQQAWYFYWRTELRRGQFLPTDLSYLFVHVYELINLIGVSSPQSGFDQLVGVWQHYRKDHAKLDNYLVDWIADFLVIHRLPVKPLDWYADALQIGAHIQGNQNLFLEAWYRCGASMELLSTNLLYSIAGLSPNRSKFYKLYHESFDFDRAFILGIKAVDDYLSQANGERVFSLKKGGKPAWVKRAPFSSAIHGYQMDSISIAQVHPWNEDAALAERVASILRQTENILRQEMNFRGQLRGVNVPAAWVEAIRSALIAPAPRRAVDIDFAAAEQIRKQSENIRKRLMVEDEMEASGTMESTPLSDVNKDKVDNNVGVFIDESGLMPLQGSGGLSFTQRPADTPDGLLTDLPLVAQIMGNGKGDSVRLLERLREHDWQTNPSLLQGSFDTAFINVLFDQLNEAAYEALGDALLFSEGDEWVVAEDYRDEIAYILDHPDYRSGRNVTVLVENSSPPPLHELSSVLESAWLDFARQLTVSQWHALVIVKAGVDVRDKLNAVARDALSTANQLIDDINQVALHFIGDTVIDASTETPSIIEEYRQPMDVLVDWRIRYLAVEASL